MNRLQHVGREWPGEYVGPHPARYLFGKNRVQPVNGKIMIGPRWILQDEIQRLFRILLLVDHEHAGYQIARSGHATAR